MTPLACANAPDAVEPPDTTEAPAWRTLIDESLSQWSDPLGSASAWMVVDGVVQAVRGGGEWLATRDQFTDFELELEFAMAPGANSGVGLRTHDSGDPRYRGYEIQLVNSQGEAPTLRNGGAVFDIRAASVMALRPPSEWNALRVRLEGQILDVWLNNTPIHERVELPPPALRDPFAQSGVGGRVSLQHSSRGVQFRKFRVRELEPSGRGVFSLD